MPEPHTVRVTYKFDSTEFFIFADYDSLQKWKADKTIPLVEVAESFDILYIPSGGNTGEAMRPSKGELESAFNTTNSDDIVKKILQDGQVKGGTHIAREEPYGFGGDKGQSAD